MPAENGDVRKGPMGVGIRVQDSLKLGAFKVEAVAAQMRGDTPMGGKDEGWGARAHILHDWIPVSAQSGSHASICMYMQGVHKQGVGSGRRA